MDHLKNIDPNNVYNGDECGLFCRLCSIQSYQPKDLVCIFGKQSKERVNVFLSASMTGEKIKPVIIA